ncbi:activator-dependent family glycosyltransferase [Nocardiopsis sp. ATB16-24]|uniref:activator-dependent family glycosyltransferase n=1 Tax=Nocardiopsis sp. ATB16-24 TaxID=3019555 RepID=UPI0025571F10|nr:activator-dependent family glycosyltransferase [Nocardiopsis sp. ATB16-24]
MRVVIATIAERSHFLAVVPLAWALRSAGHEVLVASQPELATAVTGAGLPFAPVGRGDMLSRVLRRLRERPQTAEALDWHDDRTWRVPWDELRTNVQNVVTFWWRMVNDPMADELVDLCRTWKPDLVVWDPLTFAGAVAARACGAAHVRFLWGVDTLSRMRGLLLERMREQPVASREDPLEEWLTGLAGRYGVDFDEELVCGQATLDQVPPGLRIPVSARVPVRYLGMRFVPYNGRAVVPVWLREPLERPRVCLTLGTSATDRFGGYTLSVGAVVEALADVDAEVVATVPADRRRGLESPPPNVRLVDYVPLHALAAVSTATINHGGFGSVSTSVAYGLPQVLVVDPRMFDTHVLARRVAGAGAAVELEAGCSDPEEVRRAVLRVLTDPGPASHAARLREAVLAQPSPADVVARLERLATGSGPF